MILEVWGAIFTRDIAEVERNKGCQRYPKEVITNDVVSNNFVVSIHRDMAMNITNDVVSNVCDSRF